MAIIESWYVNERKLFSLPITHSMTIHRGRNARGEKEKVLVRNEDTVILQRRHPKKRTSYIVDAPSFATEVDELLRLRHLPEYIQKSKTARKKPSEQELYQDAINIGGGISARRFGRVHSKITWKTSLHDEPVSVADRLIWKYQPAANAWVSKARTIFQV